MKLLSSEVVSEAYKVTKTVTGVECDICGKVIPANYHDRNSKYYVVTTGHHDWGSESIESRETKDVCSDCIRARFSDFLENGSSTAYFELQTERLYPDTRVTYMDSRPKKGEMDKETYDYF